MHTGRLEEADRSYDEALSLYRQLKDHLGEANALQGMGSLSLAQGIVAQAFTHSRQALALHEAIEHAAGAAGDYLGLAQVSRAVGVLDRAVVLGARAWEIYLVIDARPSQLLSLDELSRALADLKNTKGALAAMVLAWELACSLGKPDASARGERLAGRFEGVDPTGAPSDELIEQARLWLVEAIQACRNALAARGEDPLDPPLGVEDDPTRQSSH